VRFLWAALIAVILLVFWVFLVLTCPAPAAPPGGGVEVSSATLWHIFVADIFVTFWMVIIPGMFVVCFAMAAIFGAPSATREGTPRPETNLEK